MVSRMRYIFLFITAILLTACGKNEFNLEFDLPVDVTDNYNVIYFATDIKGGATVQAVASVREGKCELKGITKRPTLVYITRRNSRLPLVLYAERGNKINISGDNDEPLDWKVEGNAVNDSLSVWRLQNLDIWKDCVADSVNNAVEKFVDENPENPVSTILMLCYFDRKINERQYNRLMAGLKGEAKNPDWLGLLGRSDQLLHSYSFPARLESLIMRSLNKGGDTLKIDKKNPVFMIFWETGFQERKGIIDSIKVLEKEFPDSSRIIADICLDMDSVAWKNAMRRDSLYKDMKRFWSPLGMNDPAVMKLKVTAIPYFIVFDKEGMQSYRGKEISEAMKDYRNIFNSADSL